MEFFRKALTISATLLLLTSCGSRVESMENITKVAEEIAATLDKTSKDVIIETPDEMRPRLFGMTAFISINNVYGLRQETGIGSDLRSECKNKAPDISESELPDFCIGLIIQEVINLILKEAGDNVVKRISAQTAVLRSAKLGSMSSHFDDDIHLVEVVDLFNGVLDQYGADVIVEIDDALLNRPKNWGGLSDWEPILTGEDRYTPKTVLEGIHLIVWRLEACFRQGPGVVWLGDKCSNFSNEHSW